MPRWIVPLALALILIGMTVVAYAPAYRAGFVDFDDGEYVTDNEPVATGLNADNVAWAFTNSHSANWHPLTWISHMLDVEMFGLAPGGHHATNVAIHALNVVLLFLMLRSLTGALLPSFVVAGLFAVHPLNVESVAWIAQRKTTLSTLFAILSIWSYAAYVRRRSRWAYAISLMMFACSLMSKQMMVTMPFALLLLDYWPLERGELQPSPGMLPTLKSVVRGWLRLFPEKVPYLLLVVAASAVTLVVQQQAMHSVESYPLMDRLENGAISYVSYLTSFVWPTRLAAFYPLEAQQITLPKVVAALVFLAATTALAWWLGRRQRYLLVGWLWFLGTLVPVIGLVQVGAQAMADRYAYVPFWGLSIAIVWSLRDLVDSLLAQPIARWVAAMAGTAVLLAAAWLTFRQAETWHDTVSLFENAVAHTDGNWQAHATLAAEYHRRGEYRLAIEHCEQGSKFQRDMGRILGVWGLALFESGATDAAIEKLKQATRVAPQSPLGFTNLGWAYSQLGAYDLAAPQFAVAAKLQSAESAGTRRTAYGNWAYALLHSDQPRAAAENYELALAADPNCQYLLREAGEAHLRLHNIPRAIERLRRAVQLKPDDFQATYLLAHAYQAQADFEQAAKWFERALALQPENIDVATQLVDLAPRLKRPDGGGMLLQKLLAVALSSSDERGQLLASKIYCSLGDIAIAQKELDAAIQRYEQALAASADNYIANNNLAWLLATTSDAKRRDPPRAVSLARRACELEASPSHATLGTLAAAYAADGNRDEALRAAREAADLATKAGDKAAVEAFRQQLQLYEQGKPYIEQ